MISLCHFLLLSSAIITCQGISSTYDNRKGTCKAPALENGQHVPKKVFFQVGEWLQYHCDEGYMTAQRNIVENVQCLSSGWSAVPNCSEITCSFQPKMGLDILPVVYSNGSVAKFSCKEGFILNGSEISQCYYYGWDPPLPTCQDSGERVRCAPPPQPNNIHAIKLKSDYFSGDREIIKCKPGFQLYGAQFVVCKNGHWTSPPQCVRSHDCDDPSSISFGTLDSTTIKPKYPSGSVVMYKCNNGFEITGLQEIACINGNWSLPPACIAHSNSCRLSIDKIEQNNLVLSKSASMDKAYSDGDKILTRCKTNFYRASPSSAVECLNGEMSYPKCTQENGEIIHFICKAGYTTTDTTGLCIKEDIFYPVCYQI
ncbi:coagulation factor XIII B chain-like isoform X2 [Eleutherodactylus coqui]|uniref:coagulation factor XIII B chain-like isoform X2 n=1 Tax=Eleutherodactylus coqui TaxID=57060 RepID=UPI003462E58C